MDNYNEKNIDKHGVQVEPFNANVEAGSIVSSKGIKPRLEERHIQMIAIAGVIGTGLFVGSGGAISKGGPVGALLGYMVMGIVTTFVAWTSGEMSTFMPVTGGFTRHAARMVEPALGAAIGWNFWYTMAVTAPAEVTAAAGLIDFYDNVHVSSAVWITIFIAIIAAINFCPVRTYGESEVFFAVLKIMLIVALIIAGIVVDLGGGPNHHRLGFQYWKNPGPFNEYLVPGNTGKFLGFWSTLITATFSYGTIQVVAIAGTETSNPRKNIPEATKKTGYRVVIFYIVSMLIAGMIVPYTNKSLAISTGTASQAPFVIAFQLVGIKTFPSIINAIIITSALSCGSSCVYIASRTMYGLAHEGHAPAIFGRCNRWGVPVYSVGLTIIFLPLAYLVLGSGASQAFGWLINITTVAALISWVVLQASYLRMYNAFKVQGRSRDELVYKSPLQPYISWFSLVLTSLIIVFSGFSVFFPGNWSAANFLSAYLNIPIFIALYIFFKFFLKSKVVTLAEMNISTELANIVHYKAEMQELEEVEKSRTLWQRVVDRVM